MSTSAKYYRNISHIQLITFLCQDYDHFSMKSLLGKIYKLADKISFLYFWSAAPAICIKSQPTQNRKIHYHRYHLQSFALERLEF